MIHPWLICFNARPNAVQRLFCFPYAGAGASIFRSWSFQLPDTVEVYGVQLPGRESRLREPLLTDLRHLTPALIAALLPYLDRPFAFFGHSVGSLIHFEVTRQLRRSHQPMPWHLFVSARCAPQWPLSRSPIHQLPDPAFLAELRRYNGTPEAVLASAELIALLLPIVRADLTIDECYQYEADDPLPCPISGFAGIDDPLARVEELAAWEDQTQGTFTLRLVPGDHFFLKAQQPSILQAIAADLALLCSTGAAMPQ